MNPLSVKLDVNHDDDHNEAMLATEEGKDFVPVSHNERCKHCWSNKKVVFCAKVTTLAIFAAYVIGAIFINIWVVQPNRRVIELYGDSLVAIPTDDYYLDYHLYTDLYYLKKHFNPEVSAWGHGGYRISDLRRELHSKVFHRFDYSTVFTWRLAGPPDAVILYWDSDVDPGPKDGSDPMNNDTVAAYLNTLYDVLGDLKNRVGTVIMAGPTLVGELPRGMNAKDDTLDYYAQLNNETAAMFNVTYINTRDLYFANLPEGWNKSSGYLTRDGEHPNRRGSTLLREAFRKALLQENDLW